MSITYLTKLAEHRPPETLFHYTRVTGLKGIVENQEIWATHTQFLNDQKEYLHALNLIKEEIDKRKQKKTKDRAGEMYDYMDRLLVDMERVNICVASFSELGDSLPQWRGYCGGSGGYSLGFSSDFLKQAAERSGWELYPCIYDRSEQTQLINLLLDQVHESVVPKLKDPKDDSPAFLYSYLKANGFRFLVHSLAPVLKDASFAEEKEWRLISPPMDCHEKRFQFRTNQSLLIPYYKFPLIGKENKLKLACVRVGPTPNPQYVEMSLRNFLVKELFATISRDLPIEFSSIPYREW